MTSPGVEVIARAATDLTITRRADKNRWLHLSLCVLDAVFSINARYGGVVRVCERYAESAGLDVVVLPHREAHRVIGTNAEQRLGTFVADVRSAGVDAFAAAVLGNRARTSTRKGILKADAALQYAEALLAHGVHELADVGALLAEPDRLEAAERDLRKVRGNGLSDVRLGYLWMVAGDDEHIKPDRMVLRWLARHLGRAVDPAEARDLIAAAARRVDRTPWELDHAVWRAESGRNP
jgi:hypothetical protein